MTERGGAERAPRLLSRRRLAVVATGAAICGVTGLARATQAAGQVPPRPAPRNRLVLGQIAADGRPLEVTLSAAAVYQGGTTRVDVNQGSSGSVSAFGRSVPLSPEGGGGMAALFGIGIFDPPGPAEVVIAVDRGETSERLTRTLTVLRTAWTVDYVVLPPDLPPGTLDPAIQRAENDRLFTLYAATVTPRKWSGPWLQPVAGSITTYFGEQRSFNGGPPSGNHGGTDIGALEGTPVAAVSAGTVVLAEPLVVRGNMVVVDHGAGVLSGYAHLSRIDVRPGDAAGRGQTVGLVGSTGLSTGPHLHWEMAAGGVLVDGLRWLDGSQGFS